MARLGALRARLERRNRSRRTGDRRGAPRIATIGPLRCRAHPVRRCSSSSTWPELRFRREAPARRASMKASRVLAAMGVAPEVAAPLSFASASVRRRTKPTSTRFLAEWRRIAESCRGEGGMIYLDYQATTPGRARSGQGDAAVDRGKVRESALAVALGPRGEAAIEVARKRVEEAIGLKVAASPSPEARPRRSTGRSRGPSRGRSTAGASGSSRSRPNMPPCSTPASGWRAQGIDLTVLPVEPDGLLDLSCSRRAR